MNYKSQKSPQTRINSRKWNPPPTNGEGFRRRYFVTYGAEPFEFHGASSGAVEPYFTRVLEKSTFVCFRLFACFSCRIGVKLVYDLQVEFSKRNPSYIITIHQRNVHHFIPNISAISSLQASISSGISYFPLAIPRVCSSTRKWATR